MVVPRGLAQSAEKIGMAGKAEELQKFSAHWGTLLAHSFFDLQHVRWKWPERKRDLPK